jgi:hypothetical protein
VSAALPPIGTRVAVPVTRGGLPGYLRLTVAAYSVRGLRGDITPATAAVLDAADPDRETSLARVWAVLAAADGTRAGQYRASALDLLAGACAELDALEREILADLAALPVTA